MRRRPKVVDLQQWAATHGYTQVDKWTTPYGEVYVAEKLRDPLPQIDPMVDDDPAQQVKHFHLVWYVARGEHVEGAHFVLPVATHTWKHERMAEVRARVDQWIDLNVRRGRYTR